MTNMKRIQSQIFTVSKSSFIGLFAHHQQMCSIEKVDTDKYHNDAKRHRYLVFPRYCA